MSARFVGANDSYISMTAGNATALGTGAYTIAVLLNPNASGTGIVELLDNTATELRSLFTDATHLFGKADFSNGFGNLVNGTWYLAVQSKPAGNAHYRMGLWQYAVDGNGNATGAMSHGESVNAGNHGDNATAVSEIRIGRIVHPGDGLIAVVGLWQSVLSDAQLDTLVSTNLSAWAALNPAELISLENWNGTNGCNAVVGTSVQSGAVNATLAGANPPSFNFALTKSQQGAMAMFF